MNYKCLHCGARHIGTLVSACRVCRGSVAEMPEAPKQYKEARISCGITLSSRVSFVVPVFMHTGGVESWHRSLIKHLRLPTSIACIDASHCDGLRGQNFVSAIGYEASVSAAKASRVIICWNVSDFIIQSFATGPAPKIVVVNHADGTNAWSKKGIDAALPYADRIVSICPSADANIPAGYKKILIPNAPDPQRIIRHNVIEKPSKKLAVVMSRISKEKRIDFLAEVFGRYLPDWELWIVGERSKFVPCEIPSYENVQVFPATQTPGDYYAIADLALSATQEEGYGLASAEALLAGLPLVSTQVGFLESKPHLATIVARDTSAEDWAAAVRSARPKPIDDLEKFDDWVHSWQMLIDSLIKEKPRSQAKMDICRSNRCGHYVQEKDACGVLLSRGRAGAINYLIQHPHVSCVAENPLFGRNV